MSQDRKEGAGIYEHEWMTREELFRDYRDVGTAKQWLYDWHGANDWLFLQINSLRSETYDQLMQLITMLGNYKHFHYFLVAIALFAGVSLLVRKVRKKGAVKARSIMWLGIFIVLGAGFVANAVVVKTLKSYFEYPRPYVVYANQPIHLLEVKDDADDGLKSFPSGHVSFITLLVVALWPAFRDGYRWIPCTLIALVGWSRVSLGVHFPADVVWTVFLVTLLIIAVRKLCYMMLHKLFGLTC